MGKTRSSLKENQFSQNSWLTLFTFYLLVASVLSNNQVWPKNQAKSDRKLQIWSNFTKSYQYLPENMSHKL